MLVVYTKSGCPFCNRVLGYVEENNITIDERNVYESEVAMKELMEKGGKRQIPFLHDTDKDVMMYESGDIIQYFKDMSGDDSNLEDDIAEVCLPE